MNCAIYSSTSEVCAWFSWSESARETTDGSSVEDGWVSLMCSFKAANEVHVTVQPVCEQGYGNIPNKILFVNLLDHLVTSLTCCYKMIFCMSTRR